MAGTTAPPSFLAAGKTENQQVGKLASWRMKKLAGGRACPRRQADDQQVNKLAS
jgi:hypothetical protein